MIVALFLYAIRVSISIY
eukprot:Gb_13008 [translate_table: standard]